MLSATKYNELGEMEEKYIHGGENGSGPVLQKNDYTYNIRGWLIGINDPEDLGDDHIGMKLFYEDDSDIIMMT